MTEHHTELLSAERLGRRLRGVLTRPWGSVAATWSRADRTDPHTGAPVAASAPATARLWYVADGTKAHVDPADAPAVRTTGPQPSVSAVLVDPGTARDEQIGPRGCATSERQAAEALVAAVTGVFGLDPDAFPEDTVLVPVVGDRVFYGGGSGHLVGLEGVVVRVDEEPDLPSGLRYVQFDGEAWPNVVAVTALQRL
jgi:hypothetical protein